MYRDQYGEIVCGYWGLKGQLLCRCVDHFLILNHELDLASTQSSGG